MFSKQFKDIQFIVPKVENPPIAEAFFHEY